MLRTALNLRSASTSAGFRRGGTGAFTLAELLIVIAVITILVAIVTPVTIQGRNRARTMACLSNLRQLGGAILTYSQVWDDRLPTLTGTPFAGSDATAEWPEGSSATRMRGILLEYARSRDVFACRNDSGAPEYGYAEAEGSTFSRAGSSYLPWSAVRCGQYGVAMNGARTAGLARSTACVLLRDYGSNWHGFRSRSGLSLEASNVANSVFADGHTASIPVVTISVSGREYVCCVTRTGNATGWVYIAGGSGDVQAEMTGLHSLTGEGEDPTQIRFSVSGSVSGGDTQHNVDRVFLFGPDTTIESAFRHIVNWIESLVAA